MASLSIAAFRRSKAGFTLIELLVVISIIALLSSIILASLSTARGKGQDAAIKEIALEMRNVYELQYSNANSYAALEPASAAIGTGYICVVTTTGVNSPSNYCTVSSISACTNASVLPASSQAQQICQNYFTKVSTGGLLFGAISNSAGTSIENPANDYALYFQYSSDPTKGVCIRNSGSIMDLTGGTACLTKPY